MDFFIKSGCLTMLMQFTPKAPPGYKPVPYVPDMHAWQNNTVIATGIAHADRYTSIATLYNYASDVINADRSELFSYNHSTVIVL